MWVWLSVFGKHPNRKREVTEKTTWANLWALTANIKDIGHIFTHKFWQRHTRGILQEVVNALWWWWVEFFYNIYLLLISNLRKKKSLKAWIKWCKLCGCYFLVPFLTYFFQYMQQWVTNQAGILRVSRLNSTLEKNTFFSLYCYIKFLYRDMIQCYMIVNNNNKDDSLYDPDSKTSVAMINRLRKKKKIMKSFNRSTGHC